MSNTITKWNKTTEIWNSTDVWQLYFMCDCTKFQLKVSSVFRHVLNFPGVPIFLPILLEIRQGSKQDWVAKDPRFLHADSEDSDQTGRMPRLIWVFARRTATLLVLSCRGSYNRNLVKHMSRAMRKCVLCYMRTTKAQISLRIRAVWSAPLLCTAFTQLYWLNNTSETPATCWEEIVLLLRWKHSANNLIQ